MRKISRDIDRGGGDVLPNGSRNRHKTRKAVPELGLLGDVQDVTSQLQHGDSQDELNV